MEPLAPASSSTSSSLFAPRAVSVLLQYSVWLRPGPSYSPSPSPGHSAACLEIVVSTEPVRGVSAAEPHVSSEQLFEMAAGEVLARDWLLLSAVRASWCVERAAAAAAAVATAAATVAPVKAMIRHSGSGSDSDSDATLHRVMNGVCVEAALVRSVASVARSVQPESAFVGVGQSYWFSTRTSPPTASASIPLPLSDVPRANPPDPDPGIAPYPWRLDACAAPSLADVAFVLPFFAAHAIRIRTPRTSAVSAVAAVTAVAAVAASSDASASAVAVAAAAATPISPLPVSVSVGASVSASVGGVSSSSSVSGASGGVSVTSTAGSKARISILANVSARAPVTRHSWRPVDVADVAHASANVSSLMMDDLAQADLPFALQSFDAYVSVIFFVLFFSFQTLFQRSERLCAPNQRYVARVLRAFFRIYHCDLPRLCHSEQRQSDNVCFTAARSADI